MERHTELRSNPATTRRWIDRSRRPLPRTGAAGRRLAQSLDAATPALLRRSRGRCEARIPGICTGRGQHRHHRRRVRSDNRLVNLLHCCDACHRHIHAKGLRWARPHGFLLRRSDDPAVIGWGTITKVS